MKDLLTNLWEHLKATTSQVRLAIGVSFMLIVGAAGVMTYRSANPHMTPAFSGLDNAQFSAVTNALATAGIRFDTTSPPGPYVVFVPSQDVYKARNAVATNSALDVGPKGITTTQGASSIFDPAAKRLQENQKRDWQDLEKQLEAFNFVQSAVVRASGPPPSAFFHHRPPTVAVVVHMRGVASLDPAQRRALASTVRNGANVPEANITITDQSGSIIFDGADDQTLDEFLRFEKEWADQWTGRAQDQLDVMFGAGMTTVSVTGEFDFARTESVNEAYDPTKMKVSESSLKTSTPVDTQTGAPVGGVSGGPAGLQANLQSTAAPTGAIASATETESDMRYVYGRTTTHTEIGAPVLERITISLAVHDTLTERLPEAEGLIKGFVRFDEQRDQLFSAALPLASVALDEQGQPVLPAVEAPAAAPNRMLSMLIERGVELLAAGAFLFVLMRSLKKGSRMAPSAAPEAGVRLDQPSEEEVDLDLLARKHIEQMLEEDPEKVAALLSRWALGENYYSGSKS